MSVCIYQNKWVLVIGSFSWQSCAHVTNLWLVELVLGAGSGRLPLASCKQRDDFKTVCSLQPHSASVVFHSSERKSHNSSDKVEVLTTPSRAEKSPGSYPPRAFHKRHSGFVWAVAVSHEKQSDPVTSETLWQVFNRRKNRFWLIFLFCFCFGSLVYVCCWQARH